MATVRTPQPKRLRISCAKAARSATLCGVSAPVRLGNENMLDAAQSIEQAKRKTDALPPQSASIGGTVTGHGHGGIKALRVVPHPACAPIRHPDLRVSETVWRAAGLTTITLARRTGTSDHLGAHWPPFPLIAVEQGFRRRACKHQCEFPGEIVGILDAGVHALSTGRRV